MADLQAKKEWIYWLLTNVRFQTREVSWVLDYMMNHELILKNVVFVEYASKTPRGLVIVPKKEEGKSMTLHINGHQFENPDQIFHELRLNWKKTLYLEVALNNLWDSSLYLGALEDNPYHRWNDSVDETIFVEVDDFLTQQATEEELSNLLIQIDECLDRNDRDGFNRLSNKVKQLTTMN